jgi:hypothetical protein
MHGEGRDQRVVADLGAESRCDLADVARKARVRVDRCVPRTPGEQGEVSVAVAVDVLDNRKVVGVHLSAVEDRDVVPSADGFLDEGTTDELRSTDDENPHCPRSKGVSFHAIDHDERLPLFDRPAVSQVYVPSCASRSSAIACPAA